jgi:ATP-dependent DNA ligase
MGLEGLVSQHKERPYRAGRCDHWIKKRVHPSFERVKGSFS